MVDMQQSIQEIMDRNRLSMLIITDGYNMHSLTSYKGHTGCLVYFIDKQYILTDSRYTEQATIEAPQLECVDIGGEGYSKTIARLMKPYVEQFEKKSLMNLENHKSQDDHDNKDNKEQAEQFLIGFENEHISYSQFIAYLNAFRDAYGNVFKFFELKDRINELRIVKSSKELDCLARAEQIGDMAFEHIVEFIKPGKTEMEVALELEYFMRSHGASGLSFDTIVASGPNSSLPHAVPTDRVLQEGDFVTMDFGCIYKGYCSDMTRTIFIGDKPSDKQKLIYDTVLKAQLAALEAIKPGEKCSDIDAIARNIIRDAGYGDYFGHGLGHGVGLFIHEEPRFSPKCDAILQPGIVITVEPGIYLPGEFGVRIEDMIQITEDGYRNLASSPKELICIS